MAKDSAKAQELELTTIKESLKKAKDDLEAEREIMLKSVEETNYKKEVSEKVECST